MFLLPSLLVGIVFAVLLGGKPSRLADVQFRIGWTVPFALAIQLLIFSPAGEPLTPARRDVLHVGTYVLLLAFAAANLRVRSLFPVLAGLCLNAAAIISNGGRMPLSTGAAKTIGLGPGTHGNVASDARHLWFLGDVFALPRQLPYTNVFSVGDVLIGIGIAAFIVIASLERDPTALKPSRILAPLRAPSYRRLAGGKIVSHLGDWLTIAALIGWVYKQTGSTTSVAALMLVRLLPPVLGGSIAVAIVDRLPKHRLILWIELARGAAIAVALASVAANQQRPIFVALATSGVLAAISNAAVPALVPALLPADQLPAANAGLGMAKDGAMALGAVGAGLALSISGVWIALLVDIATFAIAAGCFAGLPAPTASRPHNTDRGVGALRYVLRNPVLRVLIVAFAAATFATGLTNATLPRLLESHLGLGAGSYGYGLAALGGGLALGGITVGFTRVGATAGRWIGLGLMLMAGLFVLLGLSDHEPTAILIIAFIGFIDGTTDVLFETSVQREADESRYGAVFGLASAVTTSTMVAAIALAPVVNRFLDAQAVVIAAGAFVVLAAVIALGTRATHERADDAQPSPAVVLPLPALPTAEAPNLLAVAPTSASSPTPPS